MKSMMRNIFYYGLVLLLALVSFYFLTESTDFKQTRTYSVIKVVDGDTIYLDNSDKIRLIGIDAPEMNYKTDNPECYALESKLALKELVKNKKVSLEYDKQRHDKYGRTLAYVYLPQGKSKPIFVNEYMVKHGYAIEKTYPPNSKHQFILKGAEDYARKNMLGLWNKCY